MRLGAVSHRPRSLGTARLAGIAWILGLCLLASAIPACSKAAPSTPTGGTAVPDVVGKTAAAAEKDLKDAGYAYTVVFQRTGPANPPPLGTVISETPAAGSAAPPGTKVTIVVYQEMFP